MAYNPKSLLNLRNGFQTTELARKAAAASAASKRRRKNCEEKADKFLDDLANMVFNKSSLDEFKEMAMKAPNQGLRAMALSLCNPKTAVTTIQWLLDRLKGKPKMALDTKVQADEGVTIVVKSEEEKKKIEDLGGLGV